MFHFIHFFASRGGSSERKWSDFTSTSMVIDFSISITATRHLAEPPILAFRLISQSSGSLRVCLDV